MLAVIAADPSGFKNAWLGGYRVDAEDGSMGPYFWATEQSFGVQFTRSESDGTHDSYPALDAAAPPDGYAQWAVGQPYLNSAATCVDIQSRRGKPCRLQKPRWVAVATVHPNKARNLHGRRKPAADAATADAAAAVAAAAGL